MTEMRKSGSRFISARGPVVVGISGVLLALLVSTAGRASEGAPEYPGVIRVNLAAVDLRPELLPRPDCSFEILLEVMDDGVSYNAYSEVICP